MSMKKVSTVLVRLQGDQSEKHVEVARSVRNGKKQASLITDYCNKPHG